MADVSSKAALLKVRNLFNSFKYFHLSLVPNIVCYSGLPPKRITHFVTFWQHFYHNFALRARSFKSENEKTFLQKKMNKDIKKWNTNDLKYLARYF